MGIGLLLLIHGAIHLLGFLKPWRLAAVPQLTGRTLVPLSDLGSRIAGLLWLLAAVVLFGSGLLRLAKQDLWWIAAGAGVVLSQALIVFQWQDARAGTLANALLLVAATTAAASFRFHRRVDDETRALLAQVPSDPVTVVRPEELSPLPPPVRRWLDGAGVVGRERARTVRLKQRGEIRTSPGGAWLPAQAEQYFTVEPPGFIWRVDVTMMGVVPVAGRDRYSDGKGNMLIQAASLVTMVDAAGDAIDQGTLLRFLGEMVWFPSAALSSYVTWEPVDGSHAKATMRHGSVSASALFSFDERGRFSGMTADRYFGGSTPPTLEKWTVRASEWRVIRGVEIPVKGDVVWELAAGDFDYYRWEIVDLEQNRPELYR